MSDKRLLKPYDKICLLVSGGQDSTCLLYSVVQLQKQWNWEIEAIYCNHFWQKSSFYTTKNVLKTLFWLKKPVSLVLTTETLNSEDKGRKWRYETGMRLKSYHQSQAILTGHTGSDRAETILFNLIRGSGTKGVSSLSWSSPRKEDLSQRFLRSMGDIHELNKTLTPFRGYHLKTFGQKTTSWFPDCFFTLKTTFCSFQETSKSFQKEE